MTKLLARALALDRADEFQDAVLDCSRALKLDPDLVIAQCKAGVVGSFPSLNARPGPVFEDWLKRITEELAEYDAKHPTAAPK